MCFRLMYVRKCVPCLIPLVLLSVAVLFSPQTRTHFCMWFSVKPLHAIFFSLSFFTSTVYPKSCFDRGSSTVRDAALVPPPILDVQRLSELFV